MRIIAVTGAASGIGKAVTQTLREQGAEVVTIDRHSADVVADLSSLEGRRRAVAAVLEHSERLDGIVSCAGISAGSPSDIVSVNFFGCTELIEGLRDALLASDAPRVVAISSEALLLPHDAATVGASLRGDETAARMAAEKAADGQQAYPSSKLALALWVKRMAVQPDWAGHGILLNAVAPGVVRTPMTDGLLATKDGRDLLNQCTPMRLGRPADPSELAALIAFMVSPANSFIVGQTIFCDGGAEATLRPDTV